MEARVSLITLGVADVARAAAFYQALGWQRSRIGGDDAAFFQIGGLVLGLFGRAALAAETGLADTGGFGGVALAHNVASREAVDATLAEAERAGGSVLKPGVDRFWGGYSGYFADPDGHPWEIAWNPDFELTGDGRTLLPS